MRRSRRALRLRLGAAILLCCSLAFPLVGRLTCHFGESITLLLAPACGCFLWLGWEATRRQARWPWVLYLAGLTLLIGGAAALATRMVRGRLLWPEIFWALYFAVGWRLAWEVWKRTVDRLGERWRRWGRRVRRAGGAAGLSDRPALRRRVRLCGCIAPLRALAVVLVFVPLLLGSLIHRIKIGNPRDLSDYAGFAIEPVQFETRDGLVLSAWFLPEPGSDSTVVVCHGAGANKGNFGDYLFMLVGQGFSGLIYDARGHGDSAGHTSTFGLCEPEDVRAAVDWLKHARPDQARHVFGLGSSMGAMTIVRAAAEDPRIEAVVLDSCFASAPLLAEQHAGRVPVIGPAYARLILLSMSLHAGRSMWELDARPALAALAPRPVLFIHAAGDFVIPPVNMDLLYACAAEPKAKWLGPGTHSNVLTTDFDAYQTRVVGWFKQARTASEAELSADGEH